LNRAAGVVFSIIQHEIIVVMTDGDHTARPAQQAGHFCSISPKIEAMGFPETGSCRAHMNNRHNRRRRYLSSRTHPGAIRVAENSDMVVGARIGENVNDSRFRQPAK